MTALWTTLVVLALIAAYFAPFVIAVKRRVPNQGSVFAIDLFLGWTLIGWVIALAMALRTTNRPPPRLPYGPGPYGNQDMRQWPPRG